MNTELNNLREKISMFHGGMSDWIKAYGRAKPTFYILFFRKKITPQQLELIRVGKGVLDQLSKKTGLAA